MQAYLIRGTAMAGKVRVFGVNATELVGELQRRHDTWPAVTAALGRAAAAGAMMGAMLKDEQKLTIQVKGDGPAGQIVIDDNARGEVSGYVEECHVDLPLNVVGNLDVAGATGRVSMIYSTKSL